MSPRQVVFRDRMEALTDRCREALDKHGKGSIQHAQANAAYEALAAQADPAWHCCAVDPDLWSLFSDLYKDDNGFRPRGHYTKIQVEDWFNARPESLTGDFA